MYFFCASNHPAVSLSYFLELLLVINELVQVTVFTACAWVNEECVSFAIVSDYMHHDKHMTIISLVKILKVLLERFPTIREINLFSDGAAQHFKQRFFLNSVTLLPEFH